MAMTNAERQARWRDRMREKMATARFALEAADEGDPLHQIVRLKQDLAKEKERSKELREKLKARDAMERVDAKMAHDQSIRAMYAEADKERLQAEVERLTEENDRLRAAPLCNAPQEDDLVDMLDEAFERGYRGATLETIGRCDANAKNDKTAAWSLWRSVLVSDLDRGTPRNGIPFYLELVEERGARLGERLALEARRDSLLEEITARDQAAEPAVSATGRKRRAA